jgi:hypothetical protein
LKEWTTQDFRNTSSTTNLVGEMIVDVPGNASMPEQVKRTNPRKKEEKKKMMMVVVVMMNYYDIYSIPYFLHFVTFLTCVLRI